MLLHDIRVVGSGNEDVEIPDGVKIHLEIRRAVRVRQRVSALKIPENISCVKRYLIRVI